MKVKALARHLNKSTKELIDFLIDVGISVNSGATKLDEETVNQVKELYKGDRVEDESLKGKVVNLETKTIQVKELAKVLKIQLSEIMQILLQKGLLLNLNSELEPKLAQEIAEQFEVILDIDQVSAKQTHGYIREAIERIQESEIEHNSEHLRTRPPVVTIMGHVDHGKTLLLDTIRKTNVVEGEAGGITQHIGAYQVVHHDRKLTFLDTPGHAAFTSLRARGSQVTDVAVLVVAADDGVMPQTIEAIHHAKAAGVPILVAINKMDKPGADPDRIKQQLTEHDLLAEDWGGKTIMVPISAKKREGIDTLLEMILLTSDMMDLQAVEEGPAKGIIIESKLSKEKGPIATLLVKTGKLVVGDSFISGNIIGKVRALHNDLGKPVDNASPGTPVEILGFSEVPSPGSLLEVMTEKEAKVKAEERRLLEKDKSSHNMNPLSLERLSAQIGGGDVRKLNLVIKSDVHGSLEAILQSIREIPSEDVAIQILHSATGPITENDVMLAYASDAIIVGFNVNANNEAERMAKDKKVELKFYSVIYKIVDDVTHAIQGLFKIEFEEVQLGEADVRQLFKFSKVGVIAGVFVTEGKLVRQAKLRIIRDKEVLFDGKLTSLKRFDDDIKEVKAGFECGVVLDGFIDYKEGDKIFCYDVVEKKRK